MSRIPNLVLRIFLIIAFVHLFVVALVMAAHSVGTLIVEWGVEKDLSKWASESEPEWFKRILVFWFTGLATGIAGVLVLRRTDFRYLAVALGAAGAVLLLVGAGIGFTLDGYQGVRVTLNLLNVVLFIASGVLIERQLRQGSGDALTPMA